LKQATGAARKRRLVAGREGRAEQQSHVGCVLLQRKVLARQHERACRIAIDIERKFAFLAQMRRRAASAADGQQRVELAARGGRFRGVDAGRGANPPDEECGGYRAPACERQRIRRIALLDQDFRKARARLLVIRVERVGAGKVLLRGLRVAIAQGEVAFREQNPPGSVRRCCSCVIEWGEQLSCALQAPRPGHRGCEADRPRKGCAPLQHGEAVAARGVELAEQQCDVRTLQARSTVLWIGVDRAVEQLLRACKFMPLLCEVGCCDEQPRRRVLPRHPGFDQGLCAAEIAGVARRAREP
jgi:hypothetical protein